GGFGRARQHREATARDVERGHEARGGRRDLRADVRFAEPGLVQRGTGGGKSSARGVTGDRLLEHQAGAHAIRRKTAELREGLVRVAGATERTAADGKIELRE